MSRRFLPAIAAFAFVLAAAGCSAEPAAPAATAPQPAPSTSTAAVEIRARADGAPSAKEVVDTFAAAGLPVPDPRDNSGYCATGVTHCSEIMTTKAVTVYVFPDETTAQEYATAPDTHRTGVVVLDYAPANTPPDDRPKYENALTSLL
ncbi:hypothetical protein DFJ67_0359 [Asanoa ferruginea]|uniref:Lipoprotein n=1 Tax=Asanoa ferruginea TaxID=53367 RepID=A0A3D9ZBW9_9ACTN|nr:hypothetical protein [Asanoa ferruginea]REF94439.1 hypothetical protein DFJ67_0359 [Asanoa ferruginea]GIF52226.1 hypothetical protein Afe04nite_67650 [Asanoa ferruginea]